ncbi:MAG: hypothetical protein RL204_2028 [Bacteroidota bacterium]|jgi:hypothetical protein
MVSSGVRNNTIAGIVMMTNRIKIFFEMTVGLPFENTVAVINEMIIVAKLTTNIGFDIGHICTLNMVAIIEVESDIVARLKGMIWIVVRLSKAFFWVMVFSLKPIRNGRPNPKYKMLNREDVTTKKTPPKGT